ncbi:hypothetical protein UlMin_027667 [Ulmus minor]
MVEAKLPPGFRFHPRDEELVCDYLMKKVISNHCDSTLLIEVDLNKCEPWDIPESACVGGKEWYFYSQRDRKYATGLRTNRATASGYWKATGKDRQVLAKSTSSSSTSQSLVGMRKTLVFYQGRAPKGRKTDWVMHEFRLEGPLVPPKLSSLQEDWVLCRVFYKNREVVAKQSMGISNFYRSETAGSKEDQKFLPPLMDAYISFDHSHDKEQVPCLSNSHLHSQTNLIPKHIPHIQTNVLQNTTTISTTTTPTSLLGGMPNFSTSPNCLDHFVGDNEVLKSVLNQLTKKVDSNSYTYNGSPSMGEVSSESYLSEVGNFPNIWSHY